MHDNLMCF